MWRNIVTPHRGLRKRRLNRSDYLCMYAEHKNRRIKIDLFVGANVFSGRSNAWEQKLTGDQGIYDFGLVCLKRPESSGRQPLPMQTVTYVRHRTLGRSKWTLSSEEKRSKYVLESFTQTS